MEKRGLVWIVLAAVLWSGGGLGIKAVPDSALAVTFWRSAFAALALLLFFRPFRVRVTLPLVLAVLSYAACLVAFVFATKMTSAANAIFLQYSGVIWVLLLSPLLLREPPRRNDAIAIGTAVAGMALFFVGRFDLSSLSGNLMALTSGIFFAFLILALRFVRGAGAQAAVTWGNVVLALAVLPFLGADLRPAAALSLPVFAALGILQIAAAYALFVKGLETVPATTASLTGMLEPILNPVWVLLFLGERPTFFSIVGGLIVLGAIAWRTITVKASPAVEEQIAPPD